MTFKRIALLTLLLAVAACQPAKPPIYSWGSYEKSLYGYYKVPGNPAPLTISLEEMIATGKKQGRVPPGIYAEYGYLLLTQGKKSEAIANFEAEKATWPESTILMNTMIKGANNGTKKLQPVQAPVKGK